MFKCHGRPTIHTTSHSPFTVCSLYVRDSLNISFDMIKKLDAFKRGMTLFIVKGHSYLEYVG